MNQINKRGIFVVLEGLDRCGKSSQCENLVHYIKESGKQVQMRRYPDRTTTIGSLINNYLKGSDNLSDEAIHLLFTANRWEQQTDLKKVLIEGTHIICDRYAYSGVVYTSAKGLDIEWCKNPDKGLIQPDIVFYLHASTEVIQSRAGFGGERYENEEFQLKVRSSFENILKNENNVVYIDASKSKEEVFEEIKKHLSKALEALPTADKEFLKLWV